MLKKYFPWLLAIGVCAFTIGLPLLGQKVFLGVDLLSIFSPWNQILEGNQTRIPVSDVWDNVIPRRALSVERFRNGDFAFWDASSAGGRELLAVPSSGLFNPVNWVYFITPITFAPGAAKLIEMIVVLAGSVLLWRRMGGTAIIGLVVGLVFAFSGFQVSWTGWSQTGVLAWLPLLFWAVERVLQDRTLRSALPFPAILGAMLLGGFPAVIVHAALAAGIYGLVRIAGDAYANRSEKPAKSLIGGGKALLFLSLFGLLAVAFAAFQLTGFEDSISQRNLNYRANGGTAIVRPKVLVTAAVPYAFGDPNQGDWLLNRNPIEAVAYIGSGALFLGALGLASIKNNPLVRSRWAFPAILGIAVFFTIPQYFRGPVSDLLNLVPTISNNPIGRIRGVWGFMFAMLAGLGAEVLIRAAVQGVWEKRIRIITIIGSSALALATVAYTIRIGLAHDLDRSVLAKSVLVALASFGAVGAIWFARHKLGAYKAAVGLIAVVAVEAWFFASAFWPSTDEQFFYPETPVHTFLQDELNGERAVTDVGTLWPGTNAFYGIQTVNGHAFHDDTYIDLIEAFAPNAFKSATFNGPNIRELEVINSPVLDRLGAQIGAVASDGRVLGNLDGVTEFSGAQEFTNGDEINLTLDGVGPIRGIELYSTEGFDTRGAFSEISLSITDGTETVETGRRFFRTFPNGHFHIPIHGEDFPSGADLDITLRFSGFEVTPTLFEVAPGEVAVAPITPADDGLRLVESRTSTLYERENALSRFRWAGNAIVETDPDARVGLLVDGVAPDTVLLTNESGISGSGLEGTVTPDLTSDHDQVSVTVEAQGEGWLVVADSLQDSWVAELNGEPVELVDADHALVAVEIPEAGTHEVLLRYDPEFKMAGFVVSGLSLLSYLGLLGFLVYRRRTSDQLVDLTEEFVGPFDDDQAADIHNSSHTGSEKANAGRSVH